MCARYAMAWSYRCPHWLVVSIVTIVSWRQRKALNVLSYGQTRVTCHSLSTYHRHWSIWTPIFYRLSIDGLWQFVICDIEDWCMWILVDMDVNSSCLILSCFNSFSLILDVIMIGVVTALMMPLTLCLSPESPWATGACHHDHHQTPSASVPLSALNSLS